MTSVLKVTEYLHEAFARLEESVDAAVVEVSQFPKLITTPGTIIEGNVAEVVVKQYHLSPDLNTDT